MSPRRFRGGNAPWSLEPTGGARALATEVGLTAEEVEEHLRRMLPLARILPLDALLDELPVSCVDGRKSHCVAGAPGGNAGLLLLLLAAWEAATGRELGDPEVDSLFRRYLDHFGAFYVHTDRDAQDRLEGALARETGMEGESIDDLVLGPPPHLRERLAELLSQPAHVGCGHLRLMLEDPEAYGVRRALVEALLRSFFRRLWEGDLRLTFDILGGDHQEEGVLSIRTARSGGSGPEGGSGGGESAPPLVTACPQHDDLDLFVHHPEAVEWLHALHAVFLVRVGLLPPGGIAGFIEAQELLGATQLNRTLERLAPGLPLFEVHVEAGAGGAADVRSVTRSGAVGTPEDGATGAASPATS
jgi:hypothetical protein